ncbi:MAG: hypothetical protein ACOCQX_01085 [Candidatus Nanoarchaeia archaeon]
MDGWEKSPFERDTELKYKQAQSFLDAVLTEYVLVDSYRNFLDMGRKNFPFVQPESLRPVNVSGDVISEREADFHNSCLLFFSRTKLPDELKWQLRYRSENQLKRENLKKEMSTVVQEEFKNSFTREQAVLQPGFKNTLEHLKNTDMAMLVGPDEKEGLGYILTHYRVPVIKNFIKSVEELANTLGYMQGTFTQDGTFDERLEKNLTHKFFEYHGFSQIIGGKRTAASNGSHILNSNGIQFTTYVGSNESRSLTRITNENVAKYVLLYIDKKAKRALKDEYQDFENQFLIDDNVGIFRVVYETNEHSRPSRPRKFDAKRQWLNIAYQHLIPNRDNADVRPIKYPAVYAKKPLVK